MPKAGTVKAAQFPTPERFTLPNGLSVILSERRDLPVVSASLVFASGSGANAAGHTRARELHGRDAGRGHEDARCASHRRRGGAARRDAHDRILAWIESQIAVTSLAAQFPAALDLMADVALHPTFPQEEVERQRASRLATLVAQKSNPAQIASRVMASALFGAGHPYGYVELGTEASNKALTRDAMVAFWKQHLVPGNAALVVVGAVSRRELEALTAKAFSDWTGQAARRARRCLRRAGPRRAADPR